MHTSKKWLALLRILLLADIITIILLVTLSFFVYRFELAPNVVNIAIIFIYITTCFLGGYLLGKKVEEKRFLWGMLLGGSYILLLIGISILVNHGVDISSTANLSALALCLAGGMLGGMVS